MGYEFICGIPVAVVAALAIVFGLFSTLERFQNWTGTLVNKPGLLTVKEKWFGVPFRRTINNLWWDWQHKGHHIQPPEQ